MLENIDVVKKYLLIQQLNDSIFPIGSYTQSYGLETYVQQNKVHDGKSFHQYLVQSIYLSFPYNELLAIKLGYAYAHYNYAQEKAIGEIVLLDQLISATKSAFEIRQASIKLGARFIKTVLKLDLAFENGIFTEYCRQIELGLAQGHHALAYGVSCGSLGLPYENSILNFAYVQLSGMINNGVKLIPLSQTVGQQLLHNLQSVLVESINKLEQLTVDDLGKTAPGFELRSIQHEKLYSRLYMS